MDKNRICDKNMDVDILEYLRNKNINIVLLELKDKGNIINFSSKCMITETFKIMSRVSAYLSIDSGLAHVAYAGDRKSIILIGGGHLEFAPNLIGSIANNLDCFG